MATPLAAALPGTSRRDLSPMRVDMGEVRAVINEIASAMRKRRFTKEVGIQTTETFLGGSIGQGNAVASTCEVDIVLFSRDLEYDKALESDQYYRNILRIINRNLKRQFEDNYRLKYYIKTGVKFVYETPTFIIHVDLLLSPFWECQRTFFSTLATVQQHQRYLLFSGLYKEQKDFIGKLEGLHVPHAQAQRVNQLIRRAKAWRLKRWEDDEGEVTRPRAYLLSILVITAYSRISEVTKEAKKFIRMAESVQTELIKLVEEITFADERYDLIVPGTDMQIRREFSSLLPRRPRICDPVNPANNLYRTGLQPDQEGRREWAVLNDRIKDINLCIIDSEILDIY